MQNARKRKKRRNGALWFLGRLVLVLEIFAAVIFGFEAISTSFLPLKLMAIIGVGMLLVMVLTGLLIWDARYRGRYVAGLLLGLLMCVGFSVGTVYVARTVDTVRNISSSRVETAAVGIYVRADNPDDFSSVAGTYSYGILAIQDRLNTNDAIAAINEEYGMSIPTKNYDGLSQLIDGLLNSEVDAIIMNSAYLELLGEMEGYENAASQLREVKVTHVEREIAEEVQPEEEIPSDRLQGTTETETEEAGMTFAMYISGIDNRGALIAKSRSDVNILAVVNTATRQVLLISTPRDYYVPLSISGGVPDKLTHAGIYGVQVSMDTLEMLYNVNVDYYFRVNFDGFVDIVDALGGVTVESSQAFSTEEYSYVEGENDLDGAQALAFVRERYAFSSGDRQRGENQMALIRAVIDKAVSPEVLANYTSLLGAVEGSFETSMSYDTISQIVRQQLSGGGDWNVVSYSVDGTGDNQIPYSMSEYAYVMIPDESTVDEAKRLIAEVYGGEILVDPNAEDETE